MVTLVERLWVVSFGKERSVRAVLGAVHGPCSRSDLSRIIGPVTISNYPHLLTRGTKPDLGSRAADIAGQEVRKSRDWG